MIEWQLNEIIAKRGISGKELANKIKVHPNTVSRLRTSEDKKMPHIDGDLLDNLCTALECSPVDLIKFTPPGQKTEEVSKMDVKSTVGRLHKITHEIIEVISPIVQIPPEKIIHVISQISNVLIENQFF
ncbi:MAG: helix-turn-helix domain-containing protein [Stigonema ocellatum SAG 48.90 = DSM 106950]|nr:helix-turn-helix domain-containing protein [Stigonema ocellatum SAG 48.90 = DSM 106950]